MSRRIPPSEATEYPYWLIIDPRQVLRPSPHAVANMITGPFLSRDAAQQHLDGRRYAFSDRAQVYCHSGHWSHDWRELCGEDVGRNPNTKEPA